jgi:NADPH2:quinone reductase
MNMKAISVENPGAEYRLVVTEVPRPVPGPGEVLIRVAGAGLNRADVVQARGAYPPPPGAPDTLGLEVSGTVEAVGQGVTVPKVGERVCALLAGGGYAEYVLASPLCLLPVPAAMDLVTAAALPEVHFTVWTNLMDAARLQPGETVLIHGGSSGIGTAAIQLCKVRGHTVFATAGSQAKCEACRNLGATLAIDYRTQDFVEKIRAATEGRGVDVILDMVGGDYVEKNFQAAARGGRIVNIAFQKGMKAEVNFGLLLMKRLSLIGTTLRARTNAEKGAIRDALAREVWPLIASGKIVPVVDQIYPLARAQEAHAHMVSSNHIGKILLSVG